MITIIPFISEDPESYPDDYFEIIETYDDGTMMIRAINDPDDVRLARKITLQ